MNIRTAKKSDLSRILSMWIDLQHLTDGLAPTGFGEPNTKIQHNQLNATLENTFKSENGFIMVADNGSEVIGCVAAFQFDKPGYERCNAAVLYSLWVDHAFRGQGIATKLVNASCDLLKESGVDSLQVGWHPINTQATSFWDKMGFTGYEIVASKPL